MRVFLSYASEDKAVAESITFALRSRRHSVFLDRDDLPAGQSHHEQIERAINESDAMIFLISPASVAQGKYTLSELALARHKWPNPSGHLLPVMVRKTPLEQISPYLKAVIILEPQGDIASETSAAINRLRAKGHAKKVGFVLCAAIVVIGLLIGILMYSQVQPVGPPEDIAQLQLHAVDLIDKGDFDQARAELDSAEKALDRISTGLSVHDRNQRGYVYKTIAQAYKRKGNKEEEERYLDKALNIFQQIRNDPKSSAEARAVAIHGIGNVEGIRGRHRAAISEYRESIRLFPATPYAWYDLFLAYVGLADEGQVDLPAMREALNRSKEVDKLPAADIANLEAELARYEQRK